MVLFNEILAQSARYTSNQSDIPVTKRQQGAMNKNVNPGRRILKIGSMEIK